MVLAAVDAARAAPAARPRARSATALAGNLCRCTGYMRIFDAVLDALRGAGRADEVVRCPPTSCARRRALDEALRAARASRAPWRPFAGGTDLMVLLEAGQAAAQRATSASGASTSCAASTSTDDDVALGALTTYTDIRAHDGAARGVPAARAAPRARPAASRRRTAAPSAATSPTPRRRPTRRRRCSSTTPSSSSSRRAARAACPTTRFHTGYKKMDLAPDELIARGAAAAATGGWTRQYYRKVGTRRAQAISKVCFAGALADRRRRRRATCASPSAASRRSACARARAEAALRGRRLDATTIAAAAAALRRDIAPIDDSDRRRDTAPRWR